MALPSDLNMTAEELVRFCRKQDAELDRYRYAVAYAAADAWDGGIDIRRRFAWARSLDSGSLLSNDQLATIGQTYLKSEGVALTS